MRVGSVFSGMNSYLFRSMCRDWLRVAFSALLDVCPHVISFRRLSLAWNSIYHLVVSWDYRRHQVFHTFMFLRSPTTSPLGPTTRLPLSVMSSPSNRPSTRNRRVNSSSPFIFSVSATMDSGVCTFDANRKTYSKIQQNMCQEIFVNKENLQYYLIKRLRGQPYHSSRAKELTLSRSYHIFKGKGKARMQMVKWCHDEVP